MSIWRDVKYLFAYVLPLSLAIALYYRGPIFSFATLWLCFGILPALELWFKGSEENLSEEEEAVQERRVWFDYLIYLNVPLLLGLLAWYFIILLELPLTALEYWGLSLSTGIYLGACGINLAHELGHRQKLGEQILAHILLTPNAYLHFFIEHNRGHHVHIATDADPASARYEQTVYGFYWQSIIGGYVSAWRLEAERLEALGLKAWHWRNVMWVYHGIFALYLGLLGGLLSWTLLPSALLVALLGVLMLETVNYIEHYGLRRVQTASGRYERVQPWHSWNSNHPLGRIVLFELTRHSDHHYKASRKYQILRHWDSPQLPLGYPASMLLSLIPPLWFRVMNPRVKAFEAQRSGGESLA